jgi:molybdopterin-guanine dinucleotide biosynthesis protein B
MKPRSVSVVGFKDSGKTRVVEALVKTLTQRGIKVATVKHTAEEVALDTPGKDTWRHRQAGAQASAILHNKGVAHFHDSPQTVQEAAQSLGNPDLIILEGFKHMETLPRILVPKNQDELEQLLNGLEIVVVSMESSLNHSTVPVVHLDDPERLADIVEDKAFHMLPGIDCGGCGYSGCKDLGKAVLRGEIEAGKCVFEASLVRLKVNGRDVLLNRFTRNVLRNVVMGVLKTLKDMDDPKNIELVIDDE